MKRIEEHLIAGASPRAWWALAAAVVSWPRRRRPRVLGAVVRGLVILLVILLAMPRAALAEEWRSGGSAGFGHGTASGVQVTADAALRLVSFAGTNLALGAPAEVDNGRKLPDSRSVTDGKTDTEYDFMQDARVIGRAVTVDLGGERLVNQVRILPGTGKVGGGQPEFFLKGYRIDVATEARSEQWATVAQRPLNQRRTIDTTEDGSWLLFEDGEPIPTLSRYVRITATREDLPNWTTIGDVEVYGVGYQAAGQYVSESHDWGTPVNVGVARWDAGEPVQTSLRIQFRTSPDGHTWPDWDGLPEYGAADGVGGVCFPGVEPARYVQYRVRLRTRDPFATPVLRGVGVEYDRRLVARSARGRVRPRQVPIGAPVQLTYRAEIDIRPQDSGVDYLVLDRWGRLDTLRLNGAAVGATGYDMWTEAEPSPQSPNLAIRLDPDRRLTSDTDVELVFTTAFYTETSSVHLALGTAQEGAVRTNLQQVTPVHADSVQVVVGGALTQVVRSGSVRLVPPVVRPGRPDEARLLFELGKVQAPVPVSVGIYDLRGRRVRTLLDEHLLSAGPISIPWNGCDSQGSALLPGIYLYRIQVHADKPTVIVRTLGVAY